MDPDRTGRTGKKAEREAPKKKRLPLPLRAVISKNDFIFI